MSYRVELTAGALADLDRLTGSLAERSPEAADRLTARFHEALPRLESFPLACGIAYESTSFPEAVRHLLFKIRRGRPYRALFIVRGELVKVLCRPGSGREAGLFHSAARPWFGSARLLPSFPIRPSCLKEEARQEPRTPKKPRMKRPWGEKPVRPEDLEG